MGYNTQIQLPNYINVYFTGTHVGTEEGEKLLHMNGIEPDYTVGPSIETIKEGEDEVINKALEVLEDKQKQ
ncbi:hypothetical protein GLW08_00680 [Pontibacillus yanchengensis]|uniref:Uncharacterized protein n=1 Tax=Pontibacillus yanchengensis TaxID=462910 RepID=A0ACC7VCC7_9BACI|nr:hypothetical protein [Pontibacillus yanchengensis]MYL51844.1 hypothetical protein [Pontibacillus yanchengensis]